MKRFIIYIALIAAASLGLKAADGDLFPYPQPPADMIRLDERCDFIISRFWRQCDFKSAMSKTEKLKSTFSDWIGFMPYASADTVHMAIDRLLASVAKNGQHTLTLAKMAEEYAYSDSADIKSAEIFLPFAKAVVSSKKIKADDKAHFASLVRKLENVRKGKPLGHLEFITPEGVKQTLANSRTQMIAVIFNDPTSSDCSLARVRLSADYNINTLIERGLLTVVFIDPGEPTSEWLQATASYPSNWVVGASPDANEWFELDNFPTILLLDGRHKVLAKEVSVDGLMAAMANMRQSAGF